MCRKISEIQIFRISLLAGLIVTVLLCCRFTVFAQTARWVRQDTLRLHVKANSDSDFDQKLKLQVRDAILAERGSLFSESGSKDQAVMTAQKALPEIERIAGEVLAEAGCPLPVKARIVHMYFPTTDYGGYALPAGEYDALRVEIGKAAGHNWFCVLYPGLCMQAASQTTGLYGDEKQQEMVEGRPEIRFAALEWLEGMKHRMNFHTGKIRD